MAALLNSLSFAFTHSFLPKYRVKYYDYIIKWCSGIQCKFGLRSAYFTVIAIVQICYSTNFCDRLCFTGRNGSVDSIVNQMFG